MARSNKPRSIKQGKERKKMEQKALLDELESIKSLLKHDYAAINIPLLNEMVAEESLAATPTTASEYINTEVITGSPLPSHKEMASHTTANKTAHDMNKESIQNSDNPFLPDHIRKRLTGGFDLHQLDLITATAEIREPASADAESGHATEVKEVKELKHSKLIDDLIESFLPEIKIKLRRKLTEELQQADLLKTK